MFSSEPFSTALGLAVLGGLLAISAIISRTGRFGVPVAVLFLMVGMLAGAEGLGRIRFDDYELAFRIGTIALVLILFDGGLNTHVSVVRRHLAPATLLATIGVAATAGLVAVAGRLLGFSWGEALLLGAIVSSTDAAAVFAILRGTGLQLQKRVQATLELESGLNDPMAVILTLGVTESLLTGRGLGWQTIAMVPLQLVVGAAFGLGFGYAGRWILRQFRPLAGGLFPVLTLAIACMSFGVPTLAWGSGFLSVYVTGVVLGNGPIPYRTAILRVHDFLAWLFQVVMFLALGLLAFPSALLEVAGLGIAIAIFLAFVARPLAVAMCLLPFRYSPRELTYVGWVGLRGAVPIILAAFPVMAGVPESDTIFNVVFFVVAASVLIQGGSVPFITPRLGMQLDVPPAPQAIVEVTSAQPLKEEFLTFYIQPASAVCGAAIANLPFPPDAAVTLIVRGDELVAPRGHVRLEQGDHVHVFCRFEDEPLIRLLFGQQHQDG